MPRSKGKPVTSEDAVPYVPSFGMSEGTREELERTGYAVDPFTGKTVKAKSEPE